MSIRQGNREIKRDFRSNTVSGTPKRCGPSKELGASLVGKKMLAAEREQKNDCGGRGVKFEIEAKNRAKKIDHDAEPR